MKEEEDQKEREKEEKERKRKRTRGQNIALGAFLNVTDPRRRERSLQVDSTCPFCNRCALSVVKYDDICFLFF